nr:hypothetical protein [Phycisphaerae bacterium]
MRHKINFLGLFLIVMCCTTQGYSQQAFTELTEFAGIVHNHSGFMYGAGVACGDFNDDGYLDLYIPTARGQANRLYLNDGDLTFTESASSAGVGDSDSEGLGAVCGDVDNDGDLDLYVVNYFDANSLFLNNGDGTFSAASASAGVDDDGPGTSASLLH